MCQVPLSIAWPLDTYRRLFNPPSMLLILGEPNRRGRRCQRHLLKPIDVAGYRRRHARCWRARAPSRVETSPARQCRSRAHPTPGSAFCTVARDPYSLFDLAAPGLPGITQVRCPFRWSGNCLLRPRGELVGVKIDYSYLGKAREG